MKTTTTSTCSCGNTKPHHVAQRLTADGIAVVLWCDGAVTGRMGYGLPGVTVVRPSSEAKLAAARAAGWLLMGEVALYNLSEVRALYAACRWAAERGEGPGAVRARLEAVSRPTIAPTWEVVRADRDGNPTERVWRLPRIRWPGLAVFDMCSSAERYELMRVAGNGETCFRTGFKFSTLVALAAHLHSEGL